MSFAENVSVLPGSQSNQRTTSPFAPPVRQARWRRRHIGIAASFLLFVLMPLIVSGWYLWTRAADQYASTLAFSVRSEEASTGLELLGGIADVSGSGANDSDILYDYLNSQHLVEQIEGAVNLSAIWAMPERDPIFSFSPTGQVEDLTSYWRRMVDVSHDTSRGIIEIRTQAFDPQSAQLINQEILTRSTELVNQINNVAHDDAVRYALEDFQRAKVQLSDARRALTEFRIANEIVNPVLDAEVHATLLASLNSQLTETLIEIEILSTNTRSADTRLVQAETRARVLRARIDEERGKRAASRSTADQSGIAELFSEYERLQVDVEFAEQRYQAARAAFDSALSDARRNTRYLAAHILPTQAQKSMFPQRGLILALIGFGGLLVWSVFALISFSFLDRR